MSNKTELADLLFPEVTISPNEILSNYPPRNLDKSAMVTRFAPSPTGFITIGSLYATFISERLAHQSDGVFYLRVEDTDKKREVDGSVADMIESLNQFGIVIDEGPTTLKYESGEYGPYIQSSRIHIYNIFIKELIKLGLAYPCFCNSNQLQNIRDVQQTQKVTTGYYGPWAAHRNFTLDQVKEEINNGKQYVIRLKSPGKITGRVTYRDLVKGDISMPENEQDVVIMKSDGIPTYHLAHVIDDFLMGTTHVIRGDEWLSSIPIHLQLFEVFSFKKPEYGHIAPIMKMDGNSKRKFSKRKDPDAAAKYYQQEGYPSEAICEYFMTLISSGFEEWKMKHSDQPYTNYNVDICKMNVSGALFDIKKLNDISKDFISRLSVEEVLDRVLIWAQKYDIQLYNLLTKDKDYSKRIFNIGRSSDKPRKDIAKWSEVKSFFAYFFDEMFDSPSRSTEDLPKTIPCGIAKQLVNDYLEVYDSDDDREQWFGKVKDISEKHGFARDMKLFKKNPGDYQGHVGDVSTILRITLTGRANTPDLYDIVQTLSDKRVRNRLIKFSSK